jgi:hypothetical protein
MILQFNSQACCSALSDIAKSLKNPAAAYPHDPAKHSIGSLTLLIWRRICTSLPLGRPAARVLRASRQSSLMSSVGGSEKPVPQQSVRRVPQASFKTGGGGLLWPCSIFPLFALKSVSRTVLLPGRCGNGHELTPLTLVPAERSTRWRCRQCGADRAAAWRRRRRGPWLKCSSGLRLRHLARGEQVFPGVSAAFAGVLIGYSVPRGRSAPARYAAMSGSNGGRSTGHT